MSNSDRLRFALDQLRPTDWEAFEGLCGAFLATDFPDLRRIGGVGDEGRDAVFAVPAMNDVVVQMSIQANWKSKIRETINTLQDSGRAFTTLIYATNKDIGPRSDGLKAELLAEGIALDARDQRYFLDRVNLSVANRDAAATLADRIVNPLLPGDELARNSPLADNDLRAGLVYLELQIRNSADARNLSRLSYDSLVLGSLRDTDRDTQRPQADIEDEIKRHLPSRDPGQVRHSVDAALKRLKSDRKIIVSGPTDSRTFALHHDQRELQAERALEILSERQIVEDEFCDLLRLVGDELEVSLRAESDLRPLVDALDNLLQSILSTEGNNFAEAVRTGSGAVKRADLLRGAEDTVTRHYPKLKSLVRSRDGLVELILETSERLFDRPSTAIQGYLRELSDAYTLFAFLNEASDVQKAVSHFFSRGRLVLDTTVLLPCLAEDDLSVQDQPFTNLLRAAMAAGMELSTTAGVANEIETHLKRALHFSRTRPGEWEGGVPYAFSHWQEVVGAGEFAKHVDKFLGDRGVEDVEFFLEQALGIEIVDLAGGAAAALPDEVRHEFTEIWRARKRVREGQSASERDLLLNHDLEMYLGVLAQRKKEVRDVFGYESWWVTQDGSAQGIFKVARSEDVALPSNPCMSPSFLSNLIALGPARNAVAPDLRSRLPVVLDIQRRGWGAIKLTEIAEEIRKKHHEEPEWAIRRRVRDAMITIKEGIGEAAELDPFAAP
jgi:hypothetical protein